MNTLKIKLLPHLTFKSLICYFRLLRYSILRLKLYIFVLLLLFITYSRKIRILFWGRSRFHSFEIFLIMFALLLPEITGIIKMILYKFTKRKNSCIELKRKDQYIVFCIDGVQKFTISKIICLNYGIIFYQNSKIMQIMTCSKASILSQFSSFLTQAPSNVKFIDHTSKAYKAKQKKRRQYIFASVLGVFFLLLTCMLSHPELKTNYERIKAVQNYCPNIIKPIFDQYTGCLRSDSAAENYKIRKDSKKSYLRKKDKVGVQ